MNTFELVSFPDADYLAWASAGEWLKEIQTANDRGAPWCIALSGGRIARRFFSATAQLASARDISFKAVQFFWSDERCVPPAHPESNYALAREHLLEPLGILDVQVHRIRGEAPPDAAAAEAAAELSRFAPRDADGQPVVDLVFLGMGEDGHVASLFPGEPEEVAASKAIFRPVVAPKPPPHRITMGYQSIAAAGQVWVLASGPSKEKALQDSLKPGARTPLGRVLKLRKSTKIFTDIRLDEPD